MLLDDHHEWESLCFICRQLQTVTYGLIVKLGTIATLQSNGDCPVCRLILCMLIPGSSPTASRLRSIWCCPYQITLRHVGGQIFTIEEDKVIRGYLLYCYFDDQKTQRPYYEITDESPSTLDYDTVKQWLVECDYHHYPCQRIHSERSARLPALTYFIDTIDNCLILGDTSLKYLALSYVWGNSIMFNTTSSNLDILTVPGALLSIGHSINSVIKDAIEVSRNLGVRYLWVDALCIVQDDEAQKERLIARMDSIYAQAYLTIIASSADNDDSGLPGVRKDTIRKDVASVQIIPPKIGDRVPSEYYASRPSLPDCLSTSSYDTRGWTFQESYLSRRCLIFTDYATFFHCDSNLDCEPQRIIDNFDNWPERNLLAYLFEKNEQTNDLCTQWNVFTWLVYNFSGRKLTYKEDGLRAFSGILAVLSKSYQWNFICGMPTLLLEQSLLFRTNSPRYRNPNFPSWSWAGWSNKVHWAHQYFNSAFHIFDDIQAHNWSAIKSEIEIKIEPSEANLAENCQAFQLRIVGNTSSTKNFYTIPVDISHMNEIPFPPRRHIWSSLGIRCGVLYDSVDQNYWFGKYKFLGLSRSYKTDGGSVYIGRRRGRCWWHTSGEVYDDERLTSSDFCLVNVLLIGEHDGKWERKGIGFVHIDAWNEVDKMKEEVVLH